jgi:signal peptidase I
MEREKIASALIESLESGKVSKIKSKVISASMEPAIKVGDICTIMLVNPKEIMIGSVIAFKRNGAITIHRIVDIREEKNKRVFYEKGDNAKLISQVMQDEILGKVISVEKEGKLINLDMPEVNKRLLVEEEHRLLDLDKELEKLSIKKGISVCLKIAEICVEFRSDDESFIKYVKSHFTDFVSEDAPCISLDVFARKNLRLLKDIEGVDMPTDALLNADSYKIVIPKAGFVITDRYSKLLIDSSFEAFQFILLALYYKLLLDNDGFMLHSSGIIKDNQALIFFGYSGSGKSTIAHLASSKYELLNDDMVPIRKIGGKFYAFGSPFWGSYYRELTSNDLSGRNEKIPIKAFLRPVKSDSNRVKKMNAIEAITTLLASSGCKTDKFYYTKMLKIITETAKSLNSSYYLYFRKDKSFLDCLNGLE